MTTGQEHLDTLLKDLSPVLMEGEFIFLTFSSARYGEYAELQPIAAFVESEGLTLVVPKHLAQEQGIAFTDVFRAITLRVHSSLVAVGLTAAVSHALTNSNISANVIAAYYHDHIFVPEQSAEQAMAALAQLSTSRHGSE